MSRGVGNEEETELVPLAVGRCNKLLERLYEAVVSQSNKKGKEKDEESSIGYHLPMQFAPRNTVFC